jgi:hypothetical protein
MRAESISKVTIQIETKDGKKFKYENPPGIVLSFIKEDLTKLIDEKAKGDFGAVHFAGKEVDIMFCLHTLILQLIDKIGEKRVMQTFQIAFVKKFREMTEQANFMEKIYKMRRNNNKDNKLSN